MKKYLLTIFVITCLLISCSPQMTIWNDIPVMAGGKEFYVPERTDVKAYTYTVTTTPEEAEKFYKEQMLPLGWDLFEEQNQEALGSQVKMLFYGKGPQTLTVEIFVKDSQTYIGFVLYE